MLTIVFIILAIIIVRTMMPKGFSPFKPAKQKHYTIPVSRIGKVFDQIKEQVYEGSSAVFIFNTWERPSRNDAVNLQFSVVNSRTGFDWILLTRRNIEDHKRFEQLAKSLGHTVVPQEKNGVYSLRVEDGDLPSLCLNVMQQFYGLNISNTVYLLAEGFRWR